MNVVLYPMHLWRKFERRWAARAARGGSRQFPSLGSESCNACGRLAGAPLHAALLASGDFTYHWRCSECRNSWQTSTYPAISADGQSNRSEHLRENAGLTLEDSAADDTGRTQFRRVHNSWRDRAETEDWLDGMTPPITRPLLQEHIGLISPAPDAPRGHLA